MADYKFLFFCKAPAKHKATCRRFNPNAFFEQKCRGCEFGHGRYVLTTSKFYLGVREKL